MALALLDPHLHLAAIAALSVPAADCRSASPGLDAFEPLRLGLASSPIGVQEAAPAEGDAELAKKLSNPIASLISFPIQFNWDGDIGAGDEGERLQVNIQPVVPFHLTDDWNLISRTILPVIDQDDVIAGTSQSGIGDITQSLFFSPVKPTESGWIWGAGPVFLFPTASADELGTEKWGAGLTAVFLKQESGWTYGALVNHIWSVAGDDDRADISNTFLQPFVSYTTSDAWTGTLNAEVTYNWEAEDAAVPINLQASKLLRIGKLPVSVGAGLRYWADSADGGPEGLGFRFVVTPLFPSG